jgi:hypothetical protein
VDAHVGGDGGRVCAVVAKTGPQDFGGEGRLAVVVPVDGLVAEITCGKR